MIKNNMTRGVSAGALAILALPHLHQWVKKHIFRPVVQRARRKPDGDQLARRGLHIQIADLDIVNVKKKGDKNFTADAEVKLRGVDKTYPVTFEVVEAKDDWIRVKGEHKFPRLDCKVGKEKTGPDESVAQDLTVKLQLTRKKT